MPARLAVAAVLCVALPSFAHAKPHQLSGVASFYSKGQRTASGERFNPKGMTAAHRTLPFGTRLRVTYGRRSVMVRINDRGPFRRKRFLDLSRGAAVQLRMTRRGTARVRAEIVPGWMFGRVPLPARRPLDLARWRTEVAAAIAPPVAMPPRPGMALGASPAGADDISDSRRPMKEEGEQIITASMIEFPPPIAHLFSPLKLFFDELRRARDHLIRTATVGGTMAKQGREVTFGRMHPVFVKRMSAAIAEARASGLPRAGCFSAYRPPGFGVGGYSDKYMSMHAYGLACDMQGIGRPGSSEARLWHRIAARHNLYNPYYGTKRWWEWNHYQITRIKAVPRGHPLRKTITARGPISEERMWRMAEALIDKGTPTTIRKHKRKSKYAYRRQHRG